MYYNRMYVVVIATFVLFTIVKGSCLEYGHSCWGAHGKRSGGGGGKLLRAAANLRSNENDGNNAAQNTKTLFDSIDELNAQNDNKQNTARLNNDEDVEAERNNVNMPEKSKLRNLIRKENARLRNRNRIADDDSMEQEERFVERWRKLPLYNLKPLTKSQLTNSENDLLQQPGKMFPIADDTLYYDFQ